MKPAESASLYEVTYVDLEGVRRIFGVAASVLAAGDLVGSVAEHPKLRLPQIRVRPRSSSRKIWRG